MSTTDFRFFYLRNKTGFPVACIAYNVSFDTRAVLYGVSTFNIRDEEIYDRHMGRCLAVGHAMLDKKTMILPNGMIKLQDIIWMLMSHLSKDKKLPTRARKAVNAWLNRAIKQEIDRRVVGAPLYYDAHSNGVSHDHNNVFESREAI